ncbi:PucR family transcriptional regulator [Solwaraspora sp. WMMB335]|uniref:PucR family transcriptional regulator n=1 Tax=Solwaraspora sp. WMMB335 TaxID=3404118 RepID=UPI003B94AE95
MDPTDKRAIGTPNSTPIEYLVLVCDLGGHRSRAAHQAVENAVAPRAVRCEEIPDGLMVTVPVGGMRERRALARTVWRALRRYLPGVPVTVAGGATWHLRGRESVAVLQARQTLVAGQAICGSGTVILMDDLGAMAFLIGRPVAHLRYFYADVLGPVMEMDDIRAEALLETTSIYLRLSSLADTARLLNLHRNTVQQRLARIAALTGLDPHDPDAKLTLQTAIMARHLVALLTDTSRAVARTRPALVDPSDPHLFPAPAAAGPRRAPTAA